ncbi:hypothetical protein M3Y95_00330400 [Aphelenchoides besseyi]|nr:hypothetical protein M3Y95_00330400 [Aphelenchoides besseyi]
MFLVLLLVFCPFVSTQSLQTLCREFCTDGTTIDENGECPRGQKLMPLLSVESFNITGQLKCRWFDEGPSNAEVMLFDRCDEKIYREIARTQVTERAPFQFTLIGRNKIVRSNLLLKVRHDCAKGSSSPGYRVSVIDLRQKIDCDSDCQRTCKQLRGVKHCGCNSEGSLMSKLGDLNCPLICAPENEKRCLPDCQQRTYCTVNLNLDLYYL